MKIWCTDKEKERLLKILSDEDKICVFGNMICLREDCIGCLKKQIDWHTVKERVYGKF